MKTRASIFLLLPMLAFLFVHHAATQNTGSAITQCGSAAGIAASPLVATVDDSVVLNVGGEWPDSCTPTYESHSINGTTVQVNTLWDYPPETFCAAVVTPWGFQIDLGQLPAGTYNTELNIGPNFCHASTFFVFEQVFQDYLPVLYHDE